MADKIGEFLTSWQQLGSDEKAKGIAAFTVQSQVEDTKRELKTTTKSDEFSSKVYDGIQLYSYYSYLYYYPTMHWSLDKTPDTDDYWVGIYEKGAADDKYLAYQWVKKAAQSSYYIGKLSTTVGPGVKSTNRSEEYELRIFKGDYQRLDAATNVLRGRILNAPCNLPHLMLIKCSLVLNPSNWTERHVTSYTPSRQQIRRLVLFQAK